MFVRNAEYKKKKRGWKAYDVKVDLDDDEKC